MSAKVMGEVWDLDLPANEQSVLLALADHADHQGNRVWPSNGLIAWKIGASEDTVSRLKKKLEERGILVQVSAAPGRVKEHRIVIANGVKKKPFEPKKRDGNFNPTPPQLAGGDKKDPPATGTDTPPQIASNPPAELCGTNRQGTVSEPSSSASQATPSPVETEHKKFYRLWKAAFFEKFGWPYKFNGGRDGKAVKNLLNEPGATAEDLMDVALRAWKAGLNDPRVAFHCSTLVNIWEIEAHWNKIQIEITSSVPKKRITHIPDATMRVIP